MSPDLALILGTFCIVVVPYAIWRAAGLGAFVPCVVLQILFGIAIGPSVLGTIAPDLQRAVLPGILRDEIHGIATLAVLFFVAMTGAHLEGSVFREHRRSLAAIGAGSIAAPFALGGAVSWWIWRSFPSAVPSTCGMWTFVLASATALSVTALPVLGAILREMGLTRQRIGQWSLGLAAINDAALWVFLALFLAAFGRGGEALAASTTTVVGGGAYLLVMYGVVRRSADAIVRGAGGPPGDGSLVAVIALTLASAAATQWLGLHYLLGAFVAGTVLPAPLRRTVIDRVEPTLVNLLTPFFFISAGLKVTITASSSDFLVMLWTTTVAASAGKIFGTAVPARALGWPWRDSLALGALLQAKGMMEIVVLSVLLDAGLLSPTMFSVLTVMALATTSLALPLTRFALSAASHDDPAQETPAQETPAQGAAAQGTATLGRP